VHNTVQITPPAIGGPKTMNKELEKELLGNNIGFIYPDILNQYYGIPSNQGSPKASQAVLSLNVGPSILNYLSLGLVMHSFCVYSILS